MVFSSLTFLYLFLPLAVLPYFLVKNRTWRNGLLLVLSLFFYAWGEPKYVVMMLAATVVAYAGGLAIETLRGRPKARKVAFVLTVCLVTANLLVFKYANFLWDTMNSIVSTGVTLPTIALPIGISFYTFQILSYVIDLYWGKVHVQRNFFYLLLYVSFFPQLIAGPIVRYSTIEDEILHRKETWDDVEAGLKRFLLGLAKKVLIANNVAALADMIYQGNQSIYGTALYWLASVAYTMQIYFDFSGYSDMAIVLGRLFGFRFLENFNYPYESRTVTEFWRRWHISLSTWFREYVYIPLGGNRKGLGRQLLNIAIVWFLTGLWHGASWNFVLWGVYYAVLLLLEKTFLLQWLDRVPAVVGHIYTCLCFIMGWVLFAITDFTQLGAYLGHMFSGTLFDGTAAYLLRSFWLVLVLAVIGCTSLPKRLWSRWEGGMAPAASDALRTAWMVLVLLVSVAFLVGDSYNPFLYFRF